MEYEDRLIRGLNPPSLVSSLDPEYSDPGVTAPGK